MFSVSRFKWQLAASLKFPHPVSKLGAPQSSTVFDVLRFGEKIPEVQRALEIEFKCIRVSTKKKTLVRVWHSGVRSWPKKKHLVRHQFDWDRYSVYVHWTLNWARSWPKKKHTLLDIRLTEIDTWCTCMGNWIEQFDWDQLEINKFLASSALPGLEKHTSPLVRLSVIVWSVSVHKTWPIELNP